MSQAYHQKVLEQKRQRLERIKRMRDEKKMTFQEIGAIEGCSRQRALDLYQQAVDSAKTPA